MVDVDSHKSISDEMPTSKTEELILKTTQLKQSSDSLFISK